ncbi:MAG TPA: trypsin-like peptidase domain-containing protein [Steroidobacteraceae bacterium]|jgi:S1-C subfamily serine protease|nr:trypsin-like peptidase domain-containing protein [Steroidobacteraceae bacterium]
MLLRRILLLGLLSLAPGTLQQTLAQGAQPQSAQQVAAQSSAAQAAIPQSEGESAAWRGTLARVAESVVAIEIDQTRAFDTEWNSSAQATGFVVDAERGLILTNRHVVTPGPVTAEATFLNREEVQLFPVYRDPVHDFGIYRYDPKKLRFIKPRSLPLYPDGAQIGREIRVIGNNAGEQLSILAGTLAKLDRDAPEYGIGKYNDFNTFYLQAASGTSGGSSGSPVIDIQGRVVALNAGGATGNASSFYLPLGRVKRALELIQAGKAVPRGSLQVAFHYTPYDELRRLGLQEKTEEAARKAFPALTGMLVVNEVLPGGPADGTLQPGDVLVRVNGKLVSEFEPLDQVMDESVDGTVEMDLERGGAPLHAKLAVGDLHAITPAAYLEFGDAVVHTLSYQMARHFNVAINGVYVANPGYVFGAAGVPRGAVISSANGKPTPNLAAFEAVVAGLADGERFTVRYSTVDDPNGSSVRSARMDRRWFPANHCLRDDAAGLWQCAALPALGFPKPEVGGSTRFAKPDDPRAAALASSLVGVGFDMPYSVSGITERNYRGTGLIVDAQRGLVVVDRNTVPVSMGDVRIIFAGTLEIPGKVEFVHPLHNLAIVSYDPKLIGNTPVKSAKLLDRKISPGDDIWVVGMGADSELNVRATQVANLTPIQLPLSRTMQFRETNLETVQLVNGPSDFDGVLTDSSGSVIALWSSFAWESGRELQQENRGVAIGIVQDMLRRVQAKQSVYSLEAELVPQPLAAARRLGLSDSWLRKLEDANPNQRQVLSVVRIVGGSPAVGRLKQGDILLAIDDKVVTRFREVELAVADKPQVNVSVLRDGEEVQVPMATAALSGLDIDRIVMWAGATLQAPHRAMIAQRGIPPEGVYVGYFAYGSPSTRYGLFPGRRIVEVDGVPTPDIDAFLKVVSGRPDRSAIRLRTITWNNAPEVITLKLDRHYWPTYEVRRAGQGWERRDLE